ncbi:Hypothetical protein (Fragment) [Durusdinium trenchii]|uniref:Uncharacterized protein n=1 Tax=Durusdinium trenchii TaxID=1381693 RepID=A0ABP0RCP6_9DINO
MNLRELQDKDGRPYHYFRMSGKDYYRAPECYIPSSNTCPGLQVQAMCPNGWTPGREVQVMGGGYLWPAFVATPWHQWMSLPLVLPFLSCMRRFSHGSRPC